MKIPILQMVRLISVSFLLVSLSISEASADPEAPTGLTPVAVGQNSVHLTWDSMEAATAYYVYRDGTIVDRITGASYTDTGLETSSVYRYQIQAIYGTGNSQVSRGKCVRTWQDPNDNTDGFVVCPPANLKIVVTQ